MTWLAGEHRRVDASEIGLAPGSWPPGVEYEGFTFYRQEIIHEADDSKEVLWGEYKEKSHAFNTKGRDMHGGGGRRLIIFND